MSSTQVMIGPSGAPATYVYNYDELGRIEQMTKQRPLSWTIPIVAETSKKIFGKISEQNQ